MKWFINLFGIQAHQLTVGSRVRTKHGMGTVIGGSINVLLDKPVTGQRENDRTWSFNLDKMHEVKKESK